MVPLKSWAVPNKTQLGVEAMTGISLYQCISYSKILHNIVRVENCQLSKTTNMLNSTVAFGEPLPERMLSSGPAFGPACW